MRTMHLKWHRFWGTEKQHDFKKWKQDQRRGQFEENEKSTWDQEWIMVIKKRFILFLSDPETADLQTLPKCLHLKPKCRTESQPWSPYSPQNPFSSQFEFYSESEPNTDQDLNYDYDPNVPHHSRIPLNQTPHNSLHLLQRNPKLHQKHIRIKSPTLIATPTIWHWYKHPALIKTIKSLTVIWTPTTTAP